MVERETQKMAAILSGCLIFRGVFSFVSLVSMVMSFPFNPIQQDQIRRMGNVVMKCGDIPGMSLALVRGTNTWTLSLGVANVETREPVTDSTHFGIGSLTKAFTSTLLLMLLRDSKQRYTMDTPLQDILHQYDLFPDDIRSQQATSKDLLSHRMGLARADLALFAGYPDTFRLGDLARAVHCLPVQASFRDNYHYSNFMYNLAGHVIETLANQSYATALKTRILGPLRMTSSITRYNITDPYDGMAQPYLTVEGKLVPAHHSLFELKQFLPSLGLASNAQDMIKWLRVQLRPYRRTRSGEEVPKVIPDQIIRSTHQPVTTHINNLLRPRFPAPDLTFAYGLGWNQAVYKGFRRMWHSGTLFGFSSFVWVFPDLGIGIFVAVNGPARVPDTRHRLNAFLYYVTDALLGDPSWLGQSTVCSYPFPSLGANQKRGATQAPAHTGKMSSLRAGSEYCGQNNTSTLNAVPLKVYIGSYHNKLFGNVKIYFNDNSNGSAETTEAPKCAARLGIRFGERFRGVLLPTNKSHVFQMKPTGIFEFSAHSSNNELSTMPVEFFDFDLSGTPYSLKAVWQTVEIIQYSRNTRYGECYSPLSSGTSYLTCMLSILQTLVTLLISSSRVSWN